MVKISTAPDPVATPRKDDESIAAVARAIGHPARVRIVRLLLDKPGCIGNDIVEEVGLAQSTVSEHLRILREAGIVIGHTDPPRVSYCLDSSQLSGLGELLTRVRSCC